MSISSLRTGAIGISAALDNNYMEPIASTLVGAGGTNSIIFNDIPQTYKHLQLRGIGRASTSDDFRIQINGDFGANYSRHLFYGTGSSAGTGVVNNDTKGNIGSLPSASNIFCGYVVDILDYVNTSKYKTVRSLGGFDANGSGSVDFFSSLWMNTTAITSIKIYGQSYNLQQHTRFSLYGIKG
jgi:hypothetical protein